MPIDKNKEIKRRPRLIYALPVIILFIITGTIGYYYLVEQKGISVEVVRNIKGGITSQESTLSPAESVQKDTKTAEEQRKTATVIADSANLRSGPSVNSERVAWTRKGAILEIMDEFKEATGKRWYKVKAPDGMEGWLADKVVTVEQK